MAVLSVTRVGRAASVLAGVFWLTCSPVALYAAVPKANSVTREYDLKAAFLFNFARFVDWPSDAFSTGATPITIGILGEDPFGESLDEIVANEIVRDRKLIVRRYSSVEQIESCQILFICPSQASQLDQIVARLGRRRVLTVGDTNGFTTHSGMIGFEMARNHLKLRINLAAARAAGLTISSQLLRQAKIVGPEAAK